MAVFTKDARREISFPLGGIGSGSVGLSGSGELIDWEIFNRPNKGSRVGYSHLAVRARTPDGKTFARVLQGDILKDLVGQYSRSGGHSGYGYGPASGTMAGLPHFRDVTFRGEYPFAHLSYGGEDFPASLTLTAFNPLIPMDADASSYPAAFFEVGFQNDTDGTLEFSAVFSVGNPFASSRNEAVRADGLCGIRLLNAGAETDSPDWGELALATDAPETDIQPSWYRGGWQDGIQTYWRELSEFRRFLPRTYDTPGRSDMATLCVNRTLAPGEKGSVRFVLSWYIPRRVAYWQSCPDENGKERSWKNYYAVLWNGAWNVAADALYKWDELYRRSDEFRRALFSSTLDKTVIEAAASNLSTLKTATCLRLEDGSFWGWEGLSETTGSCPGTCTHVWNYAYALPFLFPDLERSVRELDYRYNQFPDGAMCFRLPLPLGRGMGQVLPCADGQFGGILRTYREWKLSGDTDWLRSLWPQVKRALEYAWDPESRFGWDKNKDGVLEGRQHHTLDVELFGPSGWLEGFYLAALKAGAEMAEVMGESESAAEYRRLFESGSRYTEEHLFNGKWYAQNVDLADRSVPEHYGVPQYWNEEAGELKYQIGDGCEIDQMCAQWHAHILGLGDIFDPANRCAALDSLVKHNILDSFRNFANTWRNYALNDEGGAVICTYPEGVYKPIIPIPYNEESMNGFEYQLAGLLIAEGRDADGISLVHRIRGRYAGYNRNPYNEMECGSNYARSMASWALIPLLSGFTFDMTKGEIGFNPHRAPGETFSSVWSVSGVWGTVTADDHTVTVEKRGGDAAVTRIRLPFITGDAAAEADRGDAAFADGILTLDAAARRVTVRY